MGGTEARDVGFLTEDLTGTSTWGGRGVGGEKVALGPWLPSSTKLKLLSKGLFVKTEDGVFDPDVPTL